MTRAFADIYGVDDAFGRVEFSGRTDTAIFRDCARAQGLDERTLDDAQARFMSAYLPHLETALHEVRGRLMPGIDNLLAAIESTAGITQALGTGNFRDAGALKLRHYGIGDYFPGTPGGFGEDSESRADLIGMAIRRMTNGAAPERVVVIGDTPHDVTAAAANGAYCIGVATGRDSVETLLAAGAPVALPDLSETESVLRIIAD
jgi:phosphoglycolate phosphatase-like HAD superfamily hydrolase